LPASTRRQIVYPLQATAGEDLTLSLLLDPVQDLSAWPLQLVVTDRSGNVLLTKTTPSQITVTDGPNGRANIAVTAQDTGTTLGPGFWNYRVSRTDAGDATFLVKGPLTLKSF